MNINTLWTIVSVSVCLMISPYYVQAESNAKTGASKHCLAMAYPDFIDSVANNYVYWKDGEKTLYDDGIEKTFDEKMTDPCIKNMLDIPYLKTLSPPKGFPVNQDPGRIRYIPFFKKMYGETKGEVSKKLRPVKWPFQKRNVFLRATTVNAVDKKLEAVVKELEKLDKSYWKYLANPGGSFNWRYIAGTEILSFHSFGAAFDINAQKANYWKWSKPGADGLYKYRNNVPIEIVQIFEKHGFIWGGQWYHYDTMHFEYRPELLID